MRPELKSPGRHAAGFTLAELAIVTVIVALMLGGMLAMVSTQTDQRKWNDTQGQLETARDAIFGFAIVNGRIPCPANSNSAGAEVQVSGVCGVGGAGAVQDYYGGVVAGVTYGLLPAVTIGYQPVDSQGFALDAWGNRIRYSISRVTTPVTSSANFTNATNLKANGVAIKPNDLIVCASATGIVAGPPGSCGAAANAVTSQTTVLAVLYSPGKNGRDATVLGADEAVNENRAAANNAVFVSHTPAPAGATGGEFDDQVLWIPVGALYSKLIAAGVLP